MQENKLPYIVAIGASAGGLEALEQFIAGIKSKQPNVAFVIIQHLSPNHKSMMVDLLSRRTSMPVIRVDKVVTLEPNCLYLNSAGMNFSFRNGLLVASPKKEDEILHLPIDTFFRALAREVKSNCAGVVLSGTGSDGTRGCREIKEAGGLVLVQDPREASFDGMPVSIISDNLADFILPAAEIWQKIDDSRQAIDDGDLRPGSEEIKLRVVLDMLYDHQAVDLLVIEGRQLFVELKGE